MEGGNAVPNLKMTGRIFYLMIKPTKTKNELKGSDSEIFLVVWRLNVKVYFLNIFQERCGSNCRELTFIRYM